MCLQVRRLHHCGHDKVLTIQCAAANTLAAMGNGANESSSNIPSLSDDHAIITQFLLTQCIKKSDLPTEEQKSSKLCETCIEASAGYIPGSDRDFSDAVQLVIGMNDNKPMKWTDEHGNVWDVRDETKVSRPPPPPKDGADDGDDEEEEERIRPSEMSLFEPINFKWTDKEGNELTSRDEKQLLTKEKPGMFAAMKAPGKKRSISSLNAQYQSAMHQSFLATTPEKSPRQWPHPDSAQRNVSTGSSLLSAFQSMTSITASAPPPGPTPKRSLAEKMEYYTDKAEAGMPESPKTVDEARKKYEADRDAAKNADMTIEEWKKWKYEAEQAAAEHDSMTSPPKMAARVKMRAVDRRAAARRAAANDRIYGLGATKTSSSTTSVPRPNIDEQKTTAKEKITTIVLKLANEALTPDGADDDESSPEKRRIMSNLHSAALSAMKKNLEESMMSTPKTSGDYQSTTEEEGASSLLSSADESIISAPETGDQDTITVKKSASSIIGSDHDSVISSSTATGNQRIIVKKKSASNLLSTVQEEGQDPRPVVASLEAEIAAVKNKLASMPPTVTFSDDEDKEADAREVMSKSKKKRMKEKAKKARAAAAAEVNAETDKKSLNSILEPTTVQKRLEENKKAYNARAVSLAASAQALKNSNSKYPLGKGKAKSVKETNSATEDWPPEGAPVPWAPAAPGQELDGLRAAFAAARVRIAARAAAEKEVGYTSASSTEEENVASTPGSAAATAPDAAPDSTPKPAPPPKRKLGQMDGVKFAGLVGNLFADERNALLASAPKPTSDDQTVADKNCASEVVATPQESTVSGPETVSLNATDGAAEKNLASTQQPVAEGQTVAEKVTEFSNLAAPQDTTSSGPDTAADAIVASKVNLSPSSSPEEEKNSPSDVADTPKKSISSGPEIAAVSDAATATDVSLPSSPWIPDY